MAAPKKTRVLTESPAKPSTAGKAARRPSTAKKTTTQSRAPDELRFTKSAEQVLRQAWDLANKTGRKFVTSSCVLFAMAELNPNLSVTARFVSGWLGTDSERYRTAFAAFKRDAYNGDRPSLSYSHTFLGPVSKNMELFLRAAADYAKLTNGPTEPIGTRHLLAALLVSPAGAKEPVAHRRLRDMGLDRDQMRLEFRQWVRVNFHEGRSEAWDRILGFKTGSDDPHPNSLAGYTSEFCGIGGAREVNDYLKVGDFAEQLAELIALRETKLPLAVGLFGNWGTGKSHFMNLMDAHLKKVAGETPEDWAKRAAASGHALREDPDGKGPWCQQIVPIYFNAWHYFDTNLWASLVTEIFEALFRHVSGDQDSAEKRKEKIEQLLAELHDVRGTAAGAEEALEIAKVAKVCAEEEEKEAEQKAESVAGRRVRLQGWIDGILDNLGKLLPKEASNEKWKEAVDALNLRDAQKSYSALAARMKEFHSLQGRARAVIGAIFAKEGRGWRLGWLIGAVVTAPLLAVFLVRGAESLHAEIREVGAGIARATGLLAGIGTWCGAQINRGEKLLKRVEDMEETARKKREEKIRKDPLIRKARARIETCAKEEKAARERLAEARAKVRRIEDELRELRPERRLYRFIEQRTQAKDYRSQLGLVSLAREDFKKLNQFFLETEDVLAIELEADAKLTAGEKAAKKQQRKDLGARIDRIVLFVDDLDRCPPEKVVDVLQAVHLLLAYPLFAVVVGVDQRCLKLSLEKERSGLVQDGRGVMSGEAIATPLDYLEKIFHIPFHLPKMDGDDFANLIHNLTESRPVEQREEKGKPGGQAVADPQVAGAKIQALGDSQSGVASKVADVSPTAAAPQEEHQKEDAGASPADEEKPLRVIGSAPLFDWERKALADYHPFVSTPRGATRLLNTYRLVRAGIRKESPDVTKVDWGAFRGDEGVHGEFRIVMLLLAVAAGRPSIARDWFAKIRNEKNPELLFQILKTEQVPNAAMNEWDTFLQKAQETFDEMPPTEKQTLFKKWLDYVERFSF